MGLSSEETLSSIWQDVYFLQQPGEAPRAGISTPISQVKKLMLKEVAVHQPGCSEFVGRGGWLSHRSPGSHSGPLLQSRLSVPGGGGRLETAAVASPNSTQQSKAPQRGPRSQEIQPGLLSCRVARRVWHKCSSWWPCQAMAASSCSQESLGDGGQRTAGEELEGLGREAGLCPYKCHFVCTEADV